MSFDDQDLSVPTPETVPSPINLSHLPTSVLQSQTVEYLLQQNQDLMTRLQITIRRLTDFERQAQELSDKYKTTREQSEYFSNETNLLRDRNRRHELNLQHARSEISQLEKRIAELYTSTKDYREKLEEENFQLRGDMAHLQRYRRRIQKSVRPMVESLRERAGHYQDRAIQLESDLREVTTKLRLLMNYRRRIKRFVRPMVKSMTFNVREAERQLLELATEKSDIKNRLIQAYEHAQAIKVELEDEKAKLVEHYERRLNDTTQEAEKLRRDLVYYRQISDDANHRINSVLEAQSRSENKSILLERELDGMKASSQSIREHYDSEFKRLQAEVIRLAHHTQGKDTELATLKKALLHSEERVQKMEFENRELRAQVSGVQALWENTVRSRPSSTAELDFTENVASAAKAPAPLEVQKVLPQNINRLIDQIEAGDMGEFKNLGDFLTQEEPK